MKKETTSATKATSKPKGNEKKASAKKKADSIADTPAIKCTEVICQSNEQVTNHIPDQLTNQSATSDCLIAAQPTVQIISGFPVDVLPAKLQGIINEANATLGFPKDYIAGSMLTAMAAVIGNTHSAETMSGWKEYAILFVALVGCPGVCKSHPLSYCMQPLIDHDAEKAAQFAEALKRYNAAMELPPKERVANGYELNPVEPRRVRFMMQDVTNEAVHRILSENPRGLILMYDELSGWVKNFNRYNNGSESEFWMSVFNHKVAMSDRKSSQSGVFIRNPFLCVIGTIQPKVLTDLAANNRNANGFMERILYVFPADQTKPKWDRSRRLPSFDIATAWREILSRLIDIVPTVDSNGEIIPEDVPFSPDALDRLYQWQNEQTDSFTTAEGVAIAGKCGMSERSFKRFVKDRKGVVFVHNAHGKYTKL